MDYALDDAAHLGTLAYFAGGSIDTQPVSVRWKRVRSSAERRLDPSWLADQLAKQTGGTFMVENRAGANRNISAESVLKAPADGAAPWIGTASMLTINPAVFSQMRWKPADFRALVKGVEAPLVLLAHPSVPATNLEQLAEWVRTQGGKSAYASFSQGSPGHWKNAPGT